MSPIRNAWAIVREHWTAYLVLNGLYYGLVIAAMVYVSTNPDLQKMLMDAAGVAFNTGPMAMVGGAYGSGQVWAASAVTFMVNLLIGSLATITLPSLILPFSGLLMGVYRAVLWGLLMSPSAPEMAGPMIPHSLTLLLEGQAYILALLAVYIHGKSFLLPHSEGIETHRAGYKIGLVKTARLYILVILVLLVAAIYEALEVIYLVPLFMK